MAQMAWYDSVYRLYGVLSGLAHERGLTVGTGTNLASSISVEIFKNPGFSLASSSLRPWSQLSSEAE